MRDSSDGELGIGRQDVSTGKRRMESLDGLNDQIKHNQKYLNIRLVSGYFGFLIIIFVWAWAFSMPIQLRYTVTALALGSLLLYCFIIIKNKVNTDNIRKQQLTEYRKSKKENNKKN